MQRGMLVVVWMSILKDLCRLGHFVEVVGLWREILAHGRGRRENKASSNPNPTV